MKRKERLLQAINAVTELADELLTRKQEELDGGYADEPSTMKANIRSEKKEIETIWRNADLLKKLLS